MKVLFKRAFIVILLSVIPIMILAFSKNAPDSCKTELFKDILVPSMFYIKEILIIIGLFLGIIYGYPAIKKKLTEDHVKEIVRKIQESNRETKNRCYKLIDKNFSNTCFNEAISKENIQKLYDETQELFSSSIDSSKEIVTLIFLLKKTFQGLLRNYPHKNSYISSRDFYNFYIDILEEVIFFCTKVVNIPTTSKTKKTRYIKKDIAPYISNSRYHRYKEIELGIDYKYTSPVLISFFNKVNNVGNFHVSKAAFCISKSPIPLVRLLYHEKIYFPPVFYDMKNEMKDEFRFNLIGFKKYQEISPTKRIKYEFLYANVNQYRRFAGSVKYGEFYNNYFDGYIQSTIKDINQHKPIPGRNENFTIKIYEEDLKEIFKMNKKLIKKQMKNEVRKSTK